jgi:hypothetical protein
MLHVSGRKLRFLTLPLAFLLYLMASTTAFAQASAITYQGRLTDSGNPADGFYDFQFKLFDALTAGAQEGGTLTNGSVEVINGTFTVQLDFSPCATCFDGSARFLEISIRPAGSMGVYTVLAPRQPITSAPYALRAADAGQLGGIAASGFIQNTTSQQIMTNFNIEGTGKANVLDASTHFSIGGLRAFTVNGPFDDGRTIFTASNTFAGDSAGLNTTPHLDPSLEFGKFNSFFGAESGKANTDGAFNAFFGVQAGLFNNRGTGNSFFGYLAGPSNIDGGSNSFFGVLAGDGNTFGGANAFFGARAGQGNTSGSWNTLIGGETRVLVGNLNNATAIGSRAVVSQSDSLVLGSIEGLNFCTPIFNCNSVNVGIGTSAPAARLHVSGTGVIRARVNSNDNAGLALTLDDQPKWSVATVTGGQFQIFNDATGQNAFWIDSATNNVGIGTTSPNDKLEVNGIIRVSALGSAGGAQLCRNGSNQIAACSSSLRYKSNISALDSGFELINQLRPVTFDWKQGGEHDLGLVAEEVAKVEPLLVTHNERGEVEGVKYDRISVVLINAVKEQQRIIEHQQQQIEALKKLVCASRPKAKACK